MEKNNVARRRSLPLPLTLLSIGTVAQPRLFATRRVRHYDERKHVGFRPLAGASQEAPQLDKVRAAIGVPN